MPVFVDELEIAELAGSETIVISPKSARHARPFRSIRILAFGRSNQRTSLCRRLETYTL